MKKINYDGSKTKLRGHKYENEFNIKLGEKNAKINYSGSSADCKLIDEKLFQQLKIDLKIKGNDVSLKSGNTIQFHLGVLPELTNKESWIQNLKKIKQGTKLVTTSEHGISFEKQKEILKSIDFWNKYLRKGDILCYLDSSNNYIFFNIDDVIHFIISNTEWRLLDTGRIKGDIFSKQYITYEYRQKKNSFVLGAHCGKKGIEFINLLKENLEYYSQEKKSKHGMDPIFATEMQLRYKNNKENLLHFLSDKNIEKLKEKFDLDKELKVMIKTGKNLQFHLGSFPELTDIDIWKKSFKFSDLGYYSGNHGKSFETQKEILKSKEFWNTHFVKGHDLFCYKSNESWIFFKMDDIVNFLITYFEWNLLDSGRIKGRFKKRTYITYEYRSENHKQCFVLGAHSGNVGVKFINCLIENIPFIKLTT